MPQAQLGARFPFLCWLVWVGPLNTPFPPHFLTCVWRRLGSQARTVPEQIGAGAGHQHNKGTEVGAVNQDGSNAAFIPGLLEVERQL